MQRPVQYRTHPPRLGADRGDPNLTFDNHVTTSVSECIALPAQINRVKHCLDKNTLLTVIHALVFSKMYYCSNVWANTTNKNVRKLQAVQNFACRIVSGAKKYDHVTPLLKSLSWLPVKDQLYYRQAIMAFKCMTSQAPEYLTSQFITREQVSERATRSSQKLNLSLFRTASGQRTFYYRAQMFEGRLARNPGLNLTRVSRSCVQKHFLGYFFL